MVYRNQLITYFILTALSLPMFGWGASKSVTAAFKGLDKGKDCFLFIHQQNSQSGEAYWVEVSTSYEHQGQGLGKVVLQFNPKSEGKLLEWQNPESQEFLKVLLKSPSSSLDAPSAFRLKWLHFDHLHDATCGELEPVTNS